MSADPDQQRYLRKVQDVDSIAWVIIRHKDGTTTSFSGVSEEQVAREMRQMTRDLLAHVSLKDKPESKDRWEKSAFGTTRVASEGQA